MNKIGDFKIKGREATFMLTNLLPVEIDVCLVIRSSKVDEEASVGSSFVIKRFLVPDRAFVEEQLLWLSIPIARDLQRAWLVEVVFDQITFRLRFSVLEVTVVTWLITVVVEARLIWIDNHLPLSIKANCFPAICVCDQTNLLRCHRRDQDQQQDNQKCFHKWKVIHRGAMITQRVDDELKTASVIQGFRQSG